MSSSEVFPGSVRLLRRDKALEVEQLAILRHEIGIGLADAAAGRFSHRSVKDIAEEVRREYLAKWS